VFCILFTAVAVRAFYIQIVDRDKLLAYSRSQLIREVKEYPKRGFIYDRNGHPLAMNVQKFNVFIIPKSDTKL
jgi:cell division protein FtsI (penicillin-binding protein 3)